MSPVILDAPSSRSDDDRNSDQRTEAEDDGVSNHGLRVAIIGGGVTGLTLALGLSARGVRCTVYERSPGVREVGAGIGVSPNAERALRATDPRAHAAFLSVASPSGGDWFEWVDGTTDQRIFRLWTGSGDRGPESFRGCRRSDLLEALAGVVAADALARLQFGKTLASIEEVEEGGDGEAMLKFKDGSVEKADVVIGCDGIHSRVRQLLLGEDDPASYASYTQKYCFRTIVPMEQAEARPAILHRVHSRVMFNGPGAHIIIYPIGNQAEILNVLLVISDPDARDPLSQGSGGPEKDPSRRNRRQNRPLSRWGSKRDAIAAFAEFHPTIHGIVDLLPNDVEDEKEDVATTPVTEETRESEGKPPQQGSGGGRVLRWELYDMHEYPAPHYVRGGVCIAGDAAHAPTPHLGSGAGFGIEDALALATALQAANNMALARNHAETKTKRTSASLGRAALAAYNDVRYARTQWLTGASREACTMFQWEEGAAAGRHEPEAFGEQITQRFRQIWDYDLDGMVQDALARFRARIGSESGKQ